jgi:DNA topoisomerase-2
LWPEMRPWYKGFKGIIEDAGDSKYNTWGIIKKTPPNKTVVTELPIGMSTDKFKEYVEDLLEEKRLKSYKNYSTTEDINFALTESKDGMDCNPENLKLKTSLTTTNMVLFSSEGKIKKYNTVQDILEEFCGVRYKYYIKRRQHIIQNIERELKFLRNKWRFINDVMEEKIIVNRRDEIDIVSDLEKSGYDRFDGEGIAGYKYLLDMKIRSFTQQKLDELDSQIKNLEVRLDVITKKTETDMWIEDLDEFVCQYKKWLKK